MSTQQTPPGGSIIGISSISALVGGAGQTHYTPTKAGILSLMQSCACALGQYGIRCNALLPGTIRTQLNDKDLDDEAKKGYMEGRIPLGRLGQPHVSVFFPPTPLFLPLFFFFFSCFFFSSLPLLLGFLYAEMWRRMGRGEEKRWMGFPGYHKDESITKTELEHELTFVFCSAPATGPRRPSRLSGFRSFGLRGKWQKCAQ